MKLMIYSIKDKLTDFGPIWTAESDELATRTYKEILNNNPFREDLDLYRVGLYDSETAKITAYNEPLKIQEGFTYATGEFKV